MIIVDLPVLENVMKLNPDIKLSGYHLYSSIYETTPKLSFSYTPGYTTPDMLGLAFGSSFPIKWKTELSFEEATQDENNIKNYTDPKDFAGMVVQEITEAGEKAGEELTTVTCTGEFDFTQNTALRKAYTKKFGQDIIKDVLQSNRALQSYEQNIQKTDNSNTILRTVGETDEDFILQTVNSQYTINNGRPIFFTSLDRKVHFTSVNNIIDNVKKTKVVLHMGDVNDKPSEEFVNSTLRKYANTKKCIHLTVGPHKFRIGGKQYVKNIKPSVYYTNFENGTNMTTGFTFKPALKKKFYYPIDLMNYTMTKTSRSFAAVNRPESTFAYEAKNYVYDANDLISIEATITVFNDLHELILAGDVVTVLTKYPYSPYNGNYVVEMVEYGMEQTSPFLKLRLIRPNLDLTWVDGLKKSKDSQDFSFPFAPAFNKSLYYSI